MLNICFLIAVTIDTHHGVTHECISEGTKKECQVIRHIHFVIGCGCGGSGGSGGGSGGGGCCGGSGGGGGGKSGGSSGGGGVRRINLLMVLFWFPFKFLLITAAAINNNNFLALHHVAKFVLCVLLMMFTARDMRNAASLFLSLVLLVLVYIHETSKKFHPLTEIGAKSS
jgi:hypothetical protein